MRKVFAQLAAAAASAALLAIPAAARPAPSGEEQLAKMIAGRTAGEARGCINLSPSSNLTIIDGTAIVYKSGGRVWVNRTANPEDLDEDDVMVIERFGGSSVCRHDTIKLLDRSTYMLSGIVFLNDFVPYEKAG